MDGSRVVLLSRWAAEAPRDPRSSRAAFLLVDAQLPRAAVRAQHGFPSSPRSLPRARSTGVAWQATHLQPPQRQRHSSSPTAQSRCGVRVSPWASARPGLLSGPRSPKARGAQTRGRPSEGAAADGHVSVSQDFPHLRPPPNVLKLRAWRGSPCPCSQPERVWLKESQDGPSRGQGTQGQAPRRGRPG